MSSSSTTRPARTRRVRHVAVILVGLGIVLGASACNAAQQPREDFFYVNRERVTQGDGQLGWNPQLAAKAQAWAQHMADTNTLSHSALTANVSPGWSTLGENVGTGPAVNDVHTGFMNAPEHRDNIMAGKYSSMGVGVAQSAGRVWVVEDFEG
jgi:uncharacterized protein YkwD